MLSHPTFLADPSVASVRKLLRECLRQLDELGQSIPATHVDHALALLQTAEDQNIAELLKAAEDLIDVARHKRRLH